MWQAAEAAGAGARLRLQLPLRAGDPPRARAARGRRRRRRSSTSAPATCSRGAGTRTRASGASTARRRRPGRSATSARTSSTWRASSPARSRPSPRRCAPTCPATRSTTRSRRRSSSRTARSARSRRRGSRAGASTSRPSRSTAPPARSPTTCEHFDELLVSDGGPFRIERVSGDWWPPGHLIGWGDTFTLEYARVLAAIAGDGEVAPYCATFEDGYRAAEVCDAIQQSSTEGQPHLDRVPLALSGRVERLPFGTMPDGTKVELFVLVDGETELAVSTYGGIVQRLLVPTGTGCRETSCSASRRWRSTSTQATSISERSSAGMRTGSQGAPFELDGGRAPAAQRRRELAPRGPARVRQAGVAAGRRRCGWRRRDAVPRVHECRRRDGISGDARGRRLLPAGRGRQHPSRLPGDDRPATVLNPTGHLYWNLAGEASGAVDGQLLTLHAERYVARRPRADADGRAPPVEGTPLDFRVPRRIGAGRCTTSRSCSTGRPPPGGSSGGRPARSGERPQPLDRHDRARDPLLLRRASSTAPHAARPDGVPGTGGLALETQHFADSPNHPDSRRPCSGPARLSPRAPCGASATD